MENSNIFFQLKIYGKVYRNYKLKKNVEKTRISSKTNKKKLANVCTFRVLKLFEFQSKTKQTSYLFIKHFTFHSPAGICIVYPSLHHTRISWNVLLWPKYNREDSSGENWSTRDDTLQTSKIFTKYIILFLFGMYNLVNKYDWTLKQKKNNQY